MNDRKVQPRVRGELLEVATPRLILIAASREILSAELLGQEQLSRVTESHVPAAWPPEHHDSNTINWVLKASEQLPADSPWRLYYVALRDPRTLVGVCGYKGGPSEAGCVEVGYSVLEEFRCRGLATEAVRTLIDIAFQSGASRVAAETYPSLVPSLRVMEKCGMRNTGEGSEPGTVRFELLRTSQR